MTTFLEVTKIIENNQKAMVVVNNQEFCIIEIDPEDCSSFICINKDCDEFEFEYHEIDELIAV